MKTDILALPPAITNDEDTGFPAVFNFAGFVKI